ncbi:trypsin-like peptidase domain-containing protein [Planctomyces sp. SH-PL62]|uniref:trypsin-like peptidase domain-containing protein n=1 Tax=Planctomyces sp. SH-PL62 TaxID=1636152 RepID=UPI00078E42B0|nr:trypsin-like peptidase domain-containing protein [Planctomyces sp. SH-PL62]AMV35999.1 Periplasmic serine endoprotease DegP precursor [Planctomyces sp. SH-PL62]
MASYNVTDDGYGYDAPPPRPTTPPVRRGFVMILALLSLAVLAVYGVPFIAERAGRAWEAGRAQAASAALSKLDEQGAVSQASRLFRLATTAVSPAVVNVRSFRGSSGIGRHGLPIGGPPSDREGLRSELGSGVVIDKVNGYIVTNNHVIQDAEEIIVRLGPRDDVPARLVGADPKTDLAVLQVRTELKTAAEWGDSDKLDIGDWVLAIGSPLGFDHSVTAGIVSATERNDLRIAEYESFIQTDAAINPGNSGGPLIDLSGRIVGINTAIITQSGGYEGIGLAIPTSLARRVVEALIKDGRVTRGFLGVAMQPLDDETAKLLKFPGKPDGVVVGGVIPDGPAARADLRPGDVIVSLDGRPVHDPTGLRYVTADLGAGIDVPVVFYREGAEQKVTVTLAESPTNPEIAPLGFRVKEVDAPTPDGKPRTIVEVDRVVSAGPAFNAGLRPGMWIAAVDQTQVHSVLQFLALIRNYDLEHRLPLFVVTPDGRGAGLVILGPKAVQDQPPGQAAEGLGPPSATEGP